MPRHFLIDGYNLAYAWQPVRQKLLSDKEAGRGRLLDLLVKYKKISGAGITVVFDSRLKAPAPSGERWSGLEVIFAPGSGSADQEIYRRISSSKNRGSLTVVSSDRQVAGFAKRHGAQAMGSGEFSSLVECSLKKQRDGGEKPESVDVAEWLKIFGRDGQG